MVSEQVGKARAFHYSVKIAKTMIENVNINKQEKHMYIEAIGNSNNYHNNMQTICKQMYKIMYKTIAHGGTGHVGTSHTHIEKRALLSRNGGSPEKREDMSTKRRGTCNAHFWPIYTKYIWMLIIPKLSKYIACISSINRNYVTQAWVQLTMCNVYGKCKHYMFTHYLCSA